MPARIPVDTAKSHALAMIPKIFLCTEGSGSTPKRTAPTHAHQQGAAAIEDVIVPLLNLPLPAAGLVGRNLYLHLCCFRSQFGFLV